MKILGFEQYNEKLKINPITLDEFDRMNNRFKVFNSNEYKKEDLKTGDVCQMTRDHKIGVVILEKDDIDMTPYELNIVQNESIIMFYNPYKQTTWTYIKLVGYDSSLNIISGKKDCNICKVLPNAISLKTLKNPNELVNQLEKIKYFLHENN